MTRMALGTILPHQVSAGNMSTMTTIVSMGCDYISELQPPMGLLFIPQVIYEHGGPWWNDISRRKLIRPPELYGNSTSSVI
jgi:hypothetical protein